LIFSESRYNQNMLTLQEPSRKNTFSSQYWMKYIYIAHEGRQLPLTETVDSRLNRTERFKSDNADISEYDQIAYLR
jgi:hypothetical protein